MEFSTPFLLLKFKEINMKILISCFLACFMCLVSMPVNASSFGLSPAVISTTLGGGFSKSFQFIVSSYSGLVEIGTEGMPVTVTPISITVVEGEPITVVVKCNDGASSGTYSGRIKFLAKSSSSILAGINVICNLVISGGNSVNLTTNVLAGNTTSIGLTTTVTNPSVVVPSNGVTTYYGGGTPYVEPTRSLISTEAPQSSATGYIPPQPYIPIPSPVTTSSSTTTSAGPLLTVPTNTSSGSEAGIVLLILVVLAFAILAFLWYRQRQTRQY
jgi:hypothetical protein